MGNPTRRQPPSGGTGGSSRASAQPDYQAASGSGGNVSTPDQQAWAQFQRERARIAEGTSKQPGEEGYMTQEQGADALGAAFEELGRQLGDPALIQQGIRVREQFVNVPKEIFDQFLQISAQLAQAAGAESVRQRGNAITQSVATLRELFQNNLSLEMSVDSMQATACGLLKMVGTLASALGFKEWGDSLISAADEYMPSVDDDNYQRYFDRLENFNTDVDASTDDLETGVGFSRGIAGQAADDVNRYDRYDRRDQYDGAGSAGAPAGATGTSPLARQPGGASGASPLAVLEGGPR